MKRVLVLSGRKDSIDEIAVRVFQGEKSANLYCNKVNTPEDEKYWTKAQIVGEEFNNIRDLIPDKYKDMI